MATDEDVHGWTYPVTKLPLRGAVAVLVAVLYLHMVKCQSAVVIIFVQVVVVGQCDAMTVVTDQASVRKG